MATSSRTMSSASETPLTVKVKVLTDGEMRMGATNTYCATYVIENITGEVRMMYYPEKFKATVKKNKFLFLRKVDIGEAINVREHSVVMEGKEFPYSVESEEKFYRPTCISVGEALCSPIKRHISVTGTVQRCTGILTSEKSKRKEVSIKSTEGDGPTLTIKLWGDKASLNIPLPETQVTVSHLEVTEYRGTKQSNSTPLTEIEIAGKDEKIEMEIDAATFESNDMCILSDEKLYSVPDQLMEKIFVDKKFVSGRWIHGTAKGNKIVAVDKVVNKAKKQRKE